MKKGKADAEDYYYLSNGHGDIVQMVDKTGAVVNSYTYDEWGNISQQKETVANSFKYAGQMYDAETGLYYLKARYYDPTQGRFLNEDFYEGQITNPLSLNIYTYVKNNPLLYIDPTGHRDEMGASGGGGPMSMNIRPAPRVVNRNLNEGKTKSWSGTRISPETIAKVKNSDFSKTISKQFEEEVQNKLKIEKETIKSNLGRNIDVTPSSEHESVVKNPGFIGKPNSSIDILDPKTGEIKTRRWFGADGKAIRDVDYSHHGNTNQHPEAPHEHTWKYNSDGSVKSR